MEPYDDFECTRSKLYVRIPEHCGRDTTLYNKTRAPIVNHEFKFSHVLEASVSQDEVFEVTAKDIISGFLEGYNGTIFAYGQTGSGKTHTMEGSTAASAASASTGAASAASTSDGKGIVPRALASIFSVLNGKKDENEKVTLHVSYLEIYQEVGYDLLHVLDRSAPGVPMLPKVTVVEGPNNSTVLRNLSIHLVNSEEDAQVLLARGQVNRKVAETPMNQRSSRSHAIFTVYMSVRRGDVITRSKLHFVDLAGSERVCRTGVQGLQLAEAKYINLSLHHLEGVIIALHQDALAVQRAAALAGSTSSALPVSRSVPPSTPLNSLSKSWAGRSGRPYTADPPTKHHIPYRNSLLTMVLKDSLGGNCLTTMIATISMAEDNLSETISTCRFSQRVASILNAAKKNEEIDDKSMIKRLRKRVAELEAENSVLRYGSPGAAPEDGEGLTDEEKAACAHIVQNFLQGQIMDPVTAGITDPNKFRECMKVFKSLLVDTMHGGMQPGRAAPTRQVRGGYHQDAPTPSAAVRMTAGPMAFRDDSNTLLRNYTYLRADRDRTASRPAAGAVSGGSDATRPYLSGSGPMGRFMLGQPAVAWASPQQKRSTDVGGGKAGSAGGQGAGGSGALLAPASPYEAKQVREAMKLNRKVTEGLAQQTKEQEHLKAFHSSVLEQELELAEQDLERKTQSGVEQIARQHAYVLKLRQDGAEAELVDQEQLVERHLANRQARMELQLAAARERLSALRSGGGGDAAAAAMVSPRAADGTAAAAIAGVTFAPAGTPAADGSAGAALSAALAGSMDDKLRQYVKNNGKLNAKAVLDAMQQQDKLQKQIQDKIDRQRVLVLSRQLEVKESATRQKLLELKARLVQAGSSGGGTASAPATQQEVGGDGAETTSHHSYRTSASEALDAPSPQPLPLSYALPEQSAVQTAAANRGAHGGQPEATGTGSEMGPVSRKPSVVTSLASRHAPALGQHGANVMHQPAASSAAAALDTRRSAFVPVQQQQNGGSYSVHTLSHRPAASSNAAASPAVHSNSGPTRGLQEPQLHAVASAAAAAAGQSRPTGQTVGKGSGNWPYDSRSQQLSRPAAVVAATSGVGSAAAAGEGQRLQQADGGTVWSPVVGSGGGPDSKRRQIDEVVEKYRALRLALKQKKEEVLARAAGERQSATAPAAAAHAGQPGASDSGGRSAARAVHGGTAADHFVRQSSGRHSGSTDGQRRAAARSPAARTRGAGGGSKHSREARERGGGTGSGGRGGSGPRRQLAVTMARYKKDGLASSALHSKSSHGGGPGVDAAPGRGSSSGIGAAYVMQQMMAAAALNAAAGGGGPAVTLQQGYRALDEAPLNARLRLILSKEVMKRLVVQ